MTTVTPLAKDNYDRKEEQIFREWVRRNIQQAEQLAFLAQTAGDEAGAAFKFAKLPVYADDAEAEAGRLKQGRFYRTATGQLMVKL